MYHFLFFGELMYTVYTIITSTELHQPPPPASPPHTNTGVVYDAQRGLYALNSNGMSCNV